MQTKTHKNFKIKLSAAILLFIVCLFSNKPAALGASMLPIPSQIPDLEEQISTDVSPESPKPGDDITITLSAFGTDLNAADISWTLNGSNVKSGKGAKAITIKAGKAGATMTIIATIQPLNGNTITKTFTINPETVDVIWEARAYTPPFYRGKALFAPQENVVFVAMPNLVSTTGGVTNPSNVTYTWRQNTQVVGDRSGYGVNAFAYKGQILAAPVIVDVAVSDAGGLTAESYTSLTPTDTTMGIYEDSPIYGKLFNNELSGSFDFGDKEERTIAAYPYYFGINSKSDSDLSYTWSINGTQISVPLTQNEMTLRNSNGDEGQSIIGSSITNNSNILENANTEASVIFVKPTKVFPL
jgi:hypothetical protein